MGTSTLPHMVNAAYLRQVQIGPGRVTSFDPASAKAPSGQGCELRAEERLLRGTSTLPHVASAAYLRQVQGNKSRQVQGSGLPQSPLRETLRRI